MANNPNEISEQLFEAIDAIITERLKKVQFDKTIVGTITDNVEAAYGRYQVTTDDNIRFTAYAEVTVYAIGEKVYIRIPDNDYTKQKIIIGRYIPSNSQTKINELPSNQVYVLEDILKNLSNKVDELQVDQTDVLENRLNNLQYKLDELQVNQNYILEDIKELNLTNDTSSNNETNI